MWVLKCLESSLGFGVPFLCDLVAPHLPRRPEESLEVKGARVCHIVLLSNMAVRQGQVWKLFLVSWHGRLDEPVIGLVDVDVIAHYGVRTSKLGEVPRDMNILPTLC